MPHPAEEVLATPSPVLLIESRSSGLQNQQSRSRAGLAGRSCRARRTNLVTGRKLTAASACRWPRRHQKILGKGARLLRETARPPFFACPYFSALAFHLCLDLPAGRGSRRRAPLSSMTEPQWQKQVGGKVFPGAKKRSGRRSNHERGAWSLGSKRPSLPGYSKRGSRRSTQGTAAAPDGRDHPYQNLHPQTPNTRALCAREKRNKYIPPHWSGSVAESRGGDVGRRGEYPEYLRDEAGVDVLLQSSRECRSR